MRSDMERPRFLADEMLGTLARWLRIMGYDTEYARDLLDNEVLELARAGGRIVLTRDRQLAGRAGNGGLFIASDVLDEQLEQVVSFFGLSGGAPLTRCTVCNAELERAGREAMAGRVPDRVLSAHHEFFVCPRCGQVYWKGTHWTSIVQRMDRLRSQSR